MIVKKGDGTTRTLRPGYVVFAHGLNGGPSNMPSYPGMVRSKCFISVTSVKRNRSRRHNQDKFEGKIIHSTQYDNAREHKGKKVVVIGACTSGHDIARDHYTHGVGKVAVSLGSKIS